MGNNKILVDRVKNLAHDIYSKGKHVKINNRAIRALASAIPKFETQLDTSVDAEHIIWQMVVTNSINFCFWYGTGFKPAKGGSTLLYSIVQRAGDLQKPDSLIRELVIAGFPLLNERVANLKEVFAKKKDFYKSLPKLAKITAPEAVQLLCLTFPSFANDLFLKRAQLCVMEIHTKFGWFEETIEDLTVPADYQLPKVLREKKCINYSPELSYLVDSNIHLYRHSQFEVEIRAATIQACSLLSDYSGLSTRDVDAFLFRQKDSVKSNHHLTVTTDY